VFPLSFNIDNSTNVNNGSSDTLNKDEIFQCSSTCSDSLATDNFYRENDFSIPNSIPTLNSEGGSFNFYNSTESFAQKPLTCRLYEIPKLHVLIRD
jgi:hypothetical protein